MIVFILSWYSTAGDNSADDVATDTWAHLYIWWCLHKLYICILAVCRTKSLSLVMKIKATKKWRTFIFLYYISVKLCFMFLLLIIELLEGSKLFLTKQCKYLRFSLFQLNNPSLNIAKPQVFFAINGGPFATVHGCLNIDSHVDLYCFNSAKPSTVNDVFLTTCVLTAIFYALITCWRHVVRTKPEPGSYILFTSAECRILCTMLLCSRLWTPYLL